MLALIAKITNSFSRIFINAKNRQQLTNHNMSILASNCVGALILHDLAQKFNSPFVNLYLTPSDFIKYLKNIDHYKQAKLHFLAQQQANYPIAQLDDIVIYFMHYSSQQEAAEKWEKRSARIDVDNLFIMMTDRDGCTYQDLQDFDQLPFKNKVVFTYKAYPKIQSAVYIKGFENQLQVGDLFQYSGWLGKKYYDQFDFVRWFNNGTIT